MAFGIVLIDLLASEGLPEIDLLLSISVWRLSCHNPGVRTLRVGSNDNVRIQSESEKEVTQKDSMIFRVTTASGEERLH